MSHLADCLQAESRTQKHNQMIELIVVLFKQLLVIPDKPIDGQASLQKRLLLVFANESVYDAFNFLTQEFKE